MKLTRQVFAFGGMVLLGGALLPAGQAFAFGQQWRPAGPMAPVAGRPYQAAVTLPAFRPRAATYSDHRPRIGSPPPRPHLQTAPWQGYPSETARIPEFDRYQPVAYPPAPMPVPMWGQPFGGTAYGWAPQAPGFAHPFAWRPADRHWAVPAAGMRPRQYVAAAPRMAGLRPAQPAYTPPYGSWRPAAQAMPAAAERYSYHAPAYTGAGQPIFRGAPALRRDAHGAVPMADLRAPAQWRPEVSAAWAGDRTAFRPVAYGRSVATVLDDEVRGSRRTGDLQETLPGWVTTYQDTGYTDACSWCAGS